MGKAGLSAFYAGCVIVSLTARSPALARALIEVGVPINVVNEQGKTPLDEAEWGVAQFTHQAETFGFKDHAKTAERYAEIATMLLEAAGNVGRAGQEVGPQMRVAEAIHHALQGVAPTGYDEPWLGWLCVCLCRHRARQTRLVEVSKTFLAGCAPT